MRYSPRLQTVRKEQDRLESVQKRVTTLIPRLRNKLYKEMSREIKMLSPQKLKLCDVLIDHEMPGAFPNIHICALLEVHRNPITIQLG